MELGKGWSAGYMLKKIYSQSSPMVSCISPVGRTSPISLTYNKADLGLTEQRTIEVFKPNKRFDYFTEMWMSNHRKQLSRP